MSVGTLNGRFNESVGAEGARPDVPAGALGTPEAPAQGREGTPRAHATRPPAALPSNTVRSLSPRVGPEGKRGNVHWAPP